MPKPKLNPAPSKPRTTTLIWLLLLAATALTWWLGESGQVNAARFGSVPTLFALSGLKGWWVANDFMELRHAPALWRRLVLGWLLVVIALIVLANTLSTYV